VAVKEAIDDTPVAEQYRHHAPNWFNFDFLAYACQTGRPRYRYAFWAYENLPAT
jgi:hypothetical protein